ncbi:MAG: hypothetical protein AAB899_02810 [Patescibacteria group bacterium]
MSIDMNNGRNRKVAILAILVFVVFAWDLGRKQALNSLLVGEDLSTGSALDEDTYPSATEEASLTDEESKDGTSAATAINGESVSVKDQLAGFEVQVASLALTEIGWVGIRDKDGRVLGAGRFEAGSFKNVNIPLLRATVAGESYQVLLYVDDGDKKFDLHKDILISGPNRGVAGTNFRAL